MSLRAEIFLKRLGEYGSATCVAFHRTPRRSQWTQLGLPDLRGFAPHLRQINLYQDRPLSWSRWRSADFAAEFLGTPALQWLAHDLLHIAFYDFAVLNLGRKAFLDRHRFYEIHIASELFAVLALDYHFLVQTPVEGLAVDLSSRKWNAFQKKSSRLPDVTSYKFCKALAQLYLTGTCAWAQGDGAPEGTAAAREFHLWLGHEIRYAEKQRHYVNAWREDLEMKRPTRKQVAIENSVVVEPLWELIGLFHSADEKTWKKYLNEISGTVVHGNRGHVFSKLPKFQTRGKKGTPDFRFTDTTAFSKREIVRHIETAELPSSSDLFLFWQTLSLQAPNLLSAGQRHAAQRLAIASQSSKPIAQSVWNTVREIALAAARKGSWAVDSSGLGTFFLP